MIDRETSRRSKYNQLHTGTQAFFEPALRVWQGTDTYEHYLVITLHHRQFETQVRAMEQAMIATYHPHLDAPFVRYIHYMLRKLGLQLEQLMTPSLLGASRVTYPASPAAYVVVAVP